MVEQYYFSVRLHGWQWVLRPAVFVILAATVVLLVVLGVRSAMNARRTLGGGQMRSFRPALDADAGMALAVCGIAVAAFFSAADWAQSARTMPQIAAVFTFATAAAALLLGWWKPVDAGGTTESEVEYYDITTDFGDLSNGTIAARALHYGAFLLGFFALAYLIGVVPAIPVFVTGYMATSREPWRVSIPVALATVAACYLVFERRLSLTWRAPMWNVLALVG